MTRLNRILPYIFLLLIATFSGIFISKVIDLQSSEVKGTQTRLYKVVSVIDGDTIEVDIEGKTEKIRLVGVDTPELVDPRKTVECFAKEASEKAKQLMKGEKVRLESDASQANRDKFGRLLRYVYLEDGSLVNKVLIEEGYGFEYTYSAAYKYQQDFRQAQVRAEENNRGLWAEGICN